MTKQQRKSLQLGMNYQTARMRLVRDLLWRELVNQGKDRCHICGDSMTRENFSVSHIDAWREAGDPLASFFDLDNVAYAHYDCNTSESIERNRKSCGTTAKYRKGCRCDKCKEAQSSYRKDHHKRTYDPEKRHERYKRLGC